jgi:uncharacterized membrane protein
MGNDLGTVFGLTTFGVVFIWIITVIPILLLLYGVVRVAVSRGLRDHQKWMEKNRPVAPPQSTAGYFPNPPERSR